LAWTYARQGKNDKAIDACNKALELDPDSALSHYGLGRINVILGESEKAIKSYKKAVQLKSDFEEAYLFLGLAYAELGNQERTIDSYRQAILFDKYYPEPYFFLGIVYDESGQYKKAIESFEQAITWYNSEKTRIRINSMGIKPDLTTIYCIIGACYLRIGQALEASFAFKDSIEVDESHAEAHYGLALAYVLLDKKDEAFEEYEAVKSLKGEQFAKPLFDIIQSTGSIERKR
jgi:tetratricopeptide (TPR) repeat protein